MGCSTPHLGKGARCALPLHPSGCGSSRALNPFQSHQIVSPINHSRETSLSQHPSTWRAFLPPRPQTISWRRLHRDHGREHSRCPSLEPSHRPRSLRAPWNPDQPCAVWMPPSCRRWITPRAFRRPEPSSSDLETFLSTDTEPCTIDRALAPDQGSVFVPLYGLTLPAVTSTHRYGSAIADPCG